MDIRVSGRHLEITPAIREYAENRLAKLPRYFDRVQLIEVLAIRNHGGYEVEVIVRAERHDPFIARATNVDVYEGLDEVVDKLERQLRDFKDRIRDRKGRQPMSGTT